MVFTSIIFIFVFFPLFLICYYISLALAKKNMFAKLRLPDICLTLLSVAFVAWVGLNGVCAFVYLIVAVYAFGKIVEICKQRSKLWGKITVLFGILLILHSAEPSGLRCVSERTLSSDSGQYHK